MPAKPVPKKAATARTKAPAAVSKRDRILDAAQQLFAQGGFDGVSMRDIAAQAGVGLPLIVYHFETKQNLYRALFERFRTLLDARLTALHAPVAPGVDPLEHIVRALVLPVVQAQGGRPAWPTPSWWPGKCRTRAKPSAASWRSISIRSPWSSSMRSGPCCPGRIRTTRTGPICTRWAPW